MVMQRFVFNLLSLPTAYIISPSLILLCAWRVGADYLWMNVCSCGLIYLFRSTTSQQAEDRPPFWVNSGETRGRGERKKRKEVRKGRRNKGYNNLEEQNKFVGEREAARVTPSPTGVCRLEFNTSFYISTGRKEHVGEWDVTENTFPSFFMSNTGLPVTCHLRDTLTSSQFPTSRIRSYRSDAHSTNSLSFSETLAAFVDCLWVSTVAGPSLSPYGSFWSQAQLDFPLCFLD